MRRAEEHEQDSESAESGRAWRTTKRPMAAQGPSSATRRLSVRRFGRIFQKRPMARVSRPWMTSTRNMPPSVPTAPEAPKPRTMITEEMASDRKAIAVVMADERAGAGELVLRQALGLHDARGRPRGAAARRSRDACRRHSRRSSPAPGRRSTSPSPWRPSSPMKPTTAMAADDRRHRRQDRGDEGAEDEQAHHRADQRADDVETIWSWRDDVGDRGADDREAGDGHLEVGAGEGVVGGRLDLARRACARPTAAPSARSA